MFGRGLPYLGNPRRETAKFGLDIADHAADFIQPVRHVHAPMQATARRSTAFANVIGLIVTAGAILETADLRAAIAEIFGRPSRSVGFLCLQWRMLLGEVSPDHRCYPEIPKRRLGNLASRHLAFD